MGSSRPALPGSALRPALRFRGNRTRRLALFATRFGRFEQRHQCQQRFVQRFEPLTPNRRGELHLPAALARYPRARVLVAPGVAAKQPSLRAEPLEPEAVPALRDVLAARLIEGVPKISEVVLYHAPSRALIVTDLVFNIEEPPNWTTALVLACTGTNGKLAQSRAWNWLQKDAAAARASSAALFAWEFERVIVAHGNVIATDAQARLRAALTRTLAREIPQLVT